MAKIFFGCSMMGGYHEVTQDDLRHIVDTIESLGHKLISRHQTSPTFITDESKFTKQEIHDRDYECELLAINLN